MILLSTQEACMPPCGHKWYCYAQRHKRAPKSTVGMSFPFCSLLLSCFHFMERREYKSWCWCILKYLGSYSSSNVIVAKSMTMWCIRNSVCKVSETLRLQKLCDCWLWLAYDGGKFPCKVIVSRQCKFLQELLLIRIHLKTLHWVNTNWALSAQSSFSGCVLLIALCLLIWK